MFEGFPDVLVCDGGEVGSVLFYASHRSKEGAVTYRALVKGPVTLTVTPAGDVSTDRIFCAGETVDSLRKAGRAHDLTGP